MSASESLKFILTTDASSAIKGFQQAGAAAEAELGKAESKLDKVGGNLTKAGAGAVAFAGIAGVALFKAAGSFEDLAIRSGKMADATGLSVDQASRWIEVSGDIGIGADTIETALGKMNKTLGATPQKFAALGISIATTKTGAEDVNGTFLNTIDRLNQIKDPAERAAAAASIFGKGWQGAAELLKLSTTDIRTQLAAVSDQKVINPDELAKAKEYRASLDHLHDSVQDLTIAIGQGAAPVISKLATGLGDVIGFLSHANEVTGGFVGQVAAIGTVGVGAIGTLSLIAGQLIKLRTRFIETGADGVKSLTGLGKAAEGVGIAMGTATVALIAYDEIQRHNASNTAGLVKGFQDINRETDKQAMQVMPGLVAMWKDWKNLDPAGLLNVMAASDAAATVKTRDLMIANEDFRKKMEAQGVTVAMINTALDNEAAAQVRAKEATDKAAAALDTAKGSTDEYVGATKEATMAANAKKLADELMAGATKDAADKLALYKQQQQELNRVVDEAKKSADGYVQGLQDIRKAQLDLVPHIEDLDQALRDNDTAYFNLQKQEADNIKTQKDHKKSTDEKAQSNRDLLSTEHDVVLGLLGTAKVYADSRGDVDGSTASITDQINMLEIAKGKYPELAAEIQKYIDKLNVVPPVVDTTVTADTTPAINDVSAFRRAEEAAPLHLAAHLDNIVIDGETHAAGSTTVSGIHVAPARGTPGGAPIQSAAGEVVRARPGGALRIVAEAGRDEAIVPLNPDGSIPGGGTNGGTGGVTNIYNVTVSAKGHIATEREIVRLVVDGIIDAQRRGEIPGGWAAA